LRVKVPKDCFPGGTFKVTVPVKNPEGDSDGRDRNRFPRALQDLLDDYARAYDDWCVAKSNLDPSFETWKEKQHKFDKLAKEFPSNLLTPVDPSYLKHIMRRARQNKYKRGKTAASSVKSKAEVKEEQHAPEEEDSEEEEEEEEAQGRIVDIPGPGKVFPRLTWKENDFAF